MLRSIPISKAENVAVRGRTVPGAQPLPLFWSASSLEMNFRGRELLLDVETDFSLYEQWLSVVCNGAHIARFPLQKGRSTVPVLRGLNPERVQHIEIIKDVQPMPTDAQSRLLVHGFLTDGEFLPLEEKALRLEIIGDSITSAEGAIGAKSEEDWIPPLFCAARGYPYLLSMELRADLRVLSQSGWGALTSWDNDPNCALPRYYEQVCGVVKGEENEALGARRLNDFAAWSADVVVVNLGTNDASAFRQPPWVDPETGCRYKQRLNPDGTRNAEDEARLVRAIREFLELLRRCNPRAQLIWAYGLLGAELKDLIRGAVEDYARAAGDERAHFFLLPLGREEEKGARSHPGLPMHERAAAALAAEIRRLTV